jgi:uncharacterized membrane-anchored protein
VPESKGRSNKPAYTPPQGRGERKTARIGSPSWLPPTMVALFVIGLAWIVVYYIAGASIPFMNAMPPLANVGIGFAFLAGGFVLATKWR